MALIIDWAVAELLFCDEPCELLQQSFCLAPQIREMIEREGKAPAQSLDVMEAQGETGAVQPKHMREAVRRLRKRSGTPISRTRKAYQGLL